MSQDALASVEVRVHQSARWGRLFLPVTRLRNASLETLEADFNRDFVENHELKRLSLLEAALAHPAVTVETYPGETPPQEVHVYLRAPEVSDDPIFACVLAPPDVVRDLASRPPYLVMETASFQAMEGDVTNASIMAAIELWARRLWPFRRVPALRLSPWPGPVEPPERALEFLRLFSGDDGPPNRLTDAPDVFSPPANLVAKEFLAHERAA
jgi:hypothetical protein